MKFINNLYQDSLELLWRKKGSKQLAPHSCNEGYCCLCDAYQEAVQRKSWRTAYRIWVETAKAAVAHDEAHRKLQKVLSEALESAK